MTQSAITEVEEAREMQRAETGSLTARTMVKCTIESVYKKVFSRPFSSFI